MIVHEKSIRRGWVVRILYPTDITAIRPGDLVVTTKRTPKGWMRAVRNGQYCTIRHPVELVRPSP